MRTRDSGLPRQVRPHKQYLVMKTFLQKKEASNCLTNHNLLGNHNKQFISFYLPQIPHL